MAEKKSISAREVVADIKVGMTDEQLMAKHMLSAKGLQSLKSKLLAAGLLTQAQLDGKGGPTKVTSQVDKKALAKNIAAAVKTGLPDNEISKRCGISASKLTAVYNALIKAGYLALDDLTKRPGNFEETVDLAPETGKFPDSLVQALVKKDMTNGRPVFRWLCPACKTPHPEEYAVCPQCGIIVEKYKEKLARTQQAYKATPVVGPQQTIRDEPPKTPPSANTDSPPVPAEFTRKINQLKEARDRGILSQTEFEKKNEELMLQAKHSEAVDKLSELLAAGIITQEEFDAKKDDPLQYQSRLEKLQEALASGVLSESEFDRKKKQLLGVSSSSDSPPSKISSLSNAPGDISEAMGHVARMSLGEKLILVASGIAVLSLFLPWVEAGIFTASGFQQQGYLFLVLYIYPVAQILRRANMSKIGGGICGGLSALVSISFIGSKSATLFGREVNAAGAGIYLFTACSILLCVGVLLYKSRKKESTSSPVSSRTRSERLQGASRREADLSEEETEFGSAAITVVWKSWPFIAACGNMIVTNRRLLFRCELWWLYAVITWGLSYFVLKVAKEPLEFRWVDIDGIIPSRFFAICDGFVIRMKSGVEHRFFFTVLQANGKDKLMGLIDKRK